jgi:hypothetical protein
LHVPATHDLPLASAYQAPNPFKQRWIVLFDPLMELDLITIEYEVLELVAQVTHSAR